MVRLADLPEFERAHLRAKAMEPLGPTPFVRADLPMNRRRVVLITTAGLHVRDDEAFELTDASYRLIPGDLRGDELVMSHASANFDRTGFLEDVNIVLPIDRFRELADEGSLGSLASQHVSFMGAMLLPQAYEASVRHLAGLLKRDHVDTAFLTPV
jgi:D-proline reductase (dithiol) PrdB